MKTNTAADEGHRSPYWVSGEAAATVKTKHRPAGKRRAMRIAASLSGAAALRGPLVTSGRTPCTLWPALLPHTEICEGRASGRGEGGSAALQVAGRTTRRANYC